RQIPLEFVRFEPFVIPKKSLSGDSTERVDTRVLQVVYRVVDQSAPIFVGQQMDVFIDGSTGQKTE
ncbi:MAG TPA: secretion protein HlyD, partial [Acidobacteriota bacterium]|nr:secretion protein HlyD [Acidobacteriota bacterium]